MSGFFRVSLRITYSQFDPPCDRKFSASCAPQVSIRIGSHIDFVWRTLMETRICACCGQPFHPRPQVPHQGYCPSKPCQRERRQAWQRKKLQDDHFYRQNQQDAQRAWRDRNPDYARNYRAANPQYVEKNRAQRRGNSTLAQGFNVASTNAPIWPNSFPAGIYRIRSVPNSEIANMDVWIVELSPVCDGCPCKTDACKDRT